MREAGAPVKRIAKHLRRQNSSLRKFIADADSPGARTVGLAPGTRRELYSKRQ